LMTGPVNHDDGIAGKRVKVKQRTAVKRSSDAERDKKRGTRRLSVQRLASVLVQVPGRHSAGLQ